MTSTPSPSPNKKLLLAIAPKVHSKTSSILSNQEIINAAMAKYRDLENIPPSKPTSVKSTKLSFDHANSKDLARKQTKKVQSKPSDSERPRSRNALKPSFEALQASSPASNGQRQKQKPRTKQTKTGLKVLDSKSSNDQLSVSGSGPGSVQTNPKFTKTSVSSGGPRTPDRKSNANFYNYDDNSTKDLKEILFPDLYGPNLLPVTPAKQLNHPQNPHFPMSAKALTPPSSGVDAFAGSSFHQSPAPSTLPKPSFKRSPKTTSCVAYNQPSSPDGPGNLDSLSEVSILETPPSSPTPFEQMIASKFQQTCEPVSEVSVLENDLKRILNVKCD